MSVVRRHPLITFFVLTCALTWWAVPFGGFIAFGPLIAALIVIPTTQGLSGLKELGLRMIRWRVRWYWYVVAIGLPVAAWVFTGALNAALGAPPSLAALGSLSTILQVFTLRLIDPRDGRGAWMARFRPTEAAGQPLAACGHPDPSRARNHLACTPLLLGG